MWGLCGRLSHRGYLPAVTAFNSGHDEGLSGLSREAFDSFRSAGAEFGVDKSSNGFQKSSKPGIQPGEANLPGPPCWITQSFGIPGLGRILGGA